MNADFGIDSGTGLAAVLKGNRLKVPVNQREYKWSSDNVTDMLQDLAEAMQADRSSYFMGTIVLTKSGDELWEIADGQQRLATTTIILCVIRDLFLGMGDDKRARSFEHDFLFGIDPESAEEVARLMLNTDDNDFFYNRIIIRPSERPSDLEPKFTSHRLLKAAYDTILEYFGNLKSQVGKGFQTALLAWRRYLLSGAKVLVLKVPDSTLAFVMFETLNDRGIKTSQVDLVKNHLFEQSGKRISEIQRSWSSMRSMIESIGDDDDLFMEYMRWACCVLYGITREKEVFDRIVENSRGPVNAVRLVSALDQMATDYAALFNPEHPKWNTYPAGTRDAVRTLMALEVKQMRPLLLSIARNFTSQRLLMTYNRLVSWAVRMTIAGGSKAGRLDTFYAKLAHEVNAGKIKDYRTLLTATRGAIPSDAEFQAYFQTLRVKVSKAARYYLRSLEKTVEGAKEPAWIPNEDAAVVNLEHVMPQTACPEWAVTEQDLETHTHRLGNLALLQASQNVSAARSSFLEKKKIFANAPYRLTKMIANFDVWGIAEIEQRQKKLAADAPRTWPINP
jgi:hypothetical protein